VAIRGILDTAPSCADNGSAVALTTPKEGMGKESQEVFITNLTPQTFPEDAVRERSSRYTPRHGVYGATYLQVNQGFPQ
jgi:hypothetical protein